MLEATAAVDFGEEENILKDSAGRLWREKTEPSPRDGPPRGERRMFVAGRKFVC